LAPRRSDASTLSAAWWLSEGNIIIFDLNRQKSKEQLTMKAPSDKAKKRGDIALSKYSFDFFINFQVIQVLVILFKTF